MLPALRAEHGLRNGPVSVRPSVRPSVCPVDRQQQRRAAGLLLSALCSPRTSCCRRPRSTANAGSVMLRAEDRGSTQTCLIKYTEGEVTSQSCGHDTIAILRVKRDIM